jgi:hypothetical protein
MIARAKSKLFGVFCMPVFIFNLFLANLFAAPADLEKIRELEKAGKESPAERIVRPNVEYKASGGNDPFQRPEFEIKVKPATAESMVAIRENPASHLVVQGLIWGGRFPQAIINNKVVKIGDIIEGAQVLSIDKDGVTVSSQEMQYRLPAPAASAQPYKRP